MLVFTLCKKNRERDWFLVAHLDRVLGSRTEALPVDAAVADSECHPSLDGLDLFLAVNNRLPSRDRCLFVFRTDTVEDRPLL